MSYLRKIQYKIVPSESYKVIRNCSGCGRKTLYCNTNNFRVNANKSKIDIWLIYQCEICKHTYNLSIYERIKNEDIQPELYEKFLKNDINLSDKYGIDKSIFLRNKAVIDEKNINYKLELVADKNNLEPDIESDAITFEEGDLIEIVNDNGIRIRTDRIISEILNISRTKAQRLEFLGVLESDKIGSGNIIRIWIKGNIVD